VIADFLIGDFAFGTTANLNLASRLVRDETLPVLYETVYRKLEDDLIAFNVRPPVEYSRGYQYTKCVKRSLDFTSKLFDTFRYSRFIFRVGARGRPFEHELPSLVMLIAMPELLVLAKCKHLTSVVSTSSSHCQVVPHSPS
jgi:hypothetical protein